MTKDKVYALAVFEDVPSGTYYVSETDARGNKLGDTQAFSITYKNKTLNLNAGASLICEITNNFNKTPTSYTGVTDSELKSSYKSQYASFGGSAAAASQMAIGVGSTVPTGDSTPIALYAGLLAAALVVIILVLVLKKKKK